jgi:hypothetical protein
MSSVDVASLSLESFLNALDSVSGAMVSVSTVIDWGRPKSQGRRICGIVKGGMSNAPVGVKTYVSEIPDYPEFHNNEGNIKSTSGNWYLYSKGRALGLSHREAGCLCILGAEKYHSRLVSSF